MAKLLLLHCGYAYLFAAIATNLRGSVFISTAVEIGAVARIITLAWWSNSKTKLVVLHCGCAYLFAVFTTCVRFSLIIRTAPAWQGCNYLIADIAIFFFGE